MARNFSGPRLDCHQHFWTRERADRGDYGWMPQGGPLHEDYLPDRLAPLLEATNVRGTIAIQAAQSVEENRFLLDLARQADFVLGVSGWIPLDQPGALDTLADLASDHHLRGVRPMIRDLPDPEWATRPELRRNLRGLVDLGLRIEVLTYTEHLPAAYDVLSSIPELPAVINQVAEPVKDHEEDAHWRTLMFRHAQRDTTYCKISGMLTETPPEWTDASFQPYVDILFEAFGAHRVMFGSNWPVGGQRRDYPGVVKLNEQLTASLTPAEAEDFWRRTGERFYGVQVPEPQPGPS